MSHKKPLDKKSLGFVTTLIMLFLLLLALIGTLTAHELALIAVS